MNLKAKFKDKIESNKDKKDQIKETRIKLSEEELNNVAGGFTNVFEHSKGGAYDIEGSGIL